VQANDEKPIRALVAAIGEAFAKLDAHAFSMVFHEDADFTNVWGMTAHGRKRSKTFTGRSWKATGRVLSHHLSMLSSRYWIGAVQNGHDMGFRKGLLMLIATKQGDD
jgi:uncharacterized protein (TIGR02246 family)